MSAFDIDILYRACGFWRVSDPVTLNLGVRYDFVKGLQFDQSQNPNYLS